MTQFLFVDDIKSDEEIDHDKHDKLVELFSKAPKRKLDNELVILHDDTYSIDEMKRIMPKE